MINYNWWCPIAQDALATVSEVSGLNPQLRSYPEHLAQPLVRGMPWILYILDPPFELHLPRHTSNFHLPWSWYTLIDPSSAPWKAWAERESDQLRSFFSYTMERFQRNKGCRLGTYKSCTLFASNWLILKNDHICCLEARAAHAYLEGSHQRKVEGFAFMSRICFKYKFHQVQSTSVSLVPGGWTFNSTRREKSFTGPKFKGHDLPLIGFLSCWLLR